jgi:hypothetical protein
MCKVIEEWAEKYDRVHEKRYILKKEKQLRVAFTEIIENWLLENGILYEDYKEMLNELLTEVKIKEA